MCYAVEEYFSLKSNKHLFLTGFQRQFISDENTFYEIKVWFWAACTQLFYFVLFKYESDFLQAWEVLLTWKSVEILEGYGNYWG